jgi:hypothetical protein
MKNKLPFYSAAFTFFFVSIWVVIMIIDLPGEGQISEFEDVYAYVSKLSFGYFLTYVSATFFTLSTLVLFICLFQIYKGEHPQGAFIAIFFVPVYAALNTIVYFSQVIFVPKLIELHEVTSQQEVANFALQQFIQLNPDSFMAFINGMAYAILGIPSVIFGLIMINKRRMMKIAGILILLSGILSFIGIIGNAINNAILNKGVVISGFVFWLALIPLCISFYKSVISNKFTE